MPEYGDARISELFWAKVTLEPNDDGCWLWTAASAHGYGYWHGHRVHRLTYQVLVGPIPDGSVIDHLCRVRKCCNPAHLEPVTVRENIRRGEASAGINSRRTTCVAGHPLEGSNLYTTPNGRRQCRVCHARRVSECKQRKAAMARA